MNANGALETVIVTPAGRRRYLEVLARYLARDHRRGLFSEWHLWQNTSDPDDLAFMQRLASKHTWIRCVVGETPPSGNYSIHQFWRNYTDPTKVILRLDDDIVYIHPDAIGTLVSFRIANPQYFLVYGNTVNNSLCSHLHQRMGLIGYEHGKNGYMCCDAVGWNNALYAAQCHRAFLSHQQQPERFYLNERWELYDYERVSINVICLLGSEMNQWNGEVGSDEEHWLSNHKPAERQMMNCICGDALFAHFAFYTQRDYLDGSDLLEQYRQLSLRLCEMESAVCVA